MWDFNLLLKPSDSTPLYLQISHSIVADIRNSRLSPGDPLPGTRRMAQRLNVHRNTVMAAYDALISQGWLVARAAGGTFVSADLPFAEPHPISTPAPARLLPTASPTACGKATALWQQVGFALPSAPSPLYAWQAHVAQTFAAAALRHPDALSLAYGTPDVGLFPAAALGRAYRRVLCCEADTTLGMDYPAGHPRVRDVLARMLAAQRGMVVNADNTFVTRGTVMALRLIAEVLLRPGDTVVVEDPGYPTAWDTLHSAGVHLLPVHVDREGLQVAELQKILAQQPIRALYVTPHHQYPTTAVMSAARRLKLLQLARQHRFAIIEDDYDHVFHYDGEPIRPLAAGDTHGVVIYMASLSKLLAPGIRLGFIAAPQAFITQLLNLRNCFDVQGDLTLQLALADMAAAGDMMRHLRRARRLYVSRRDAFIAFLQQYMGKALSLEIPKGGLSLWVRLASRRQTPHLPGGPSLIEAWAVACAQRRVYFHTMRRFSFHAEAGHAARLCFAHLSETQLQSAAQRLAAAYATLH